MPRNSHAKPQEGFVLVLALLTLLFVGIVVVTGSERTGQETRVSQAEAPIATLQAAAEAGLLTLRQQIDLAGQTGGLCDDETDDAKQFCECLVDSNDEVSSTRLAEIMGDEGYTDSESLFSSQEGLPDTYWWFKSNDSLLVCFEGTTNTECQSRDLIPKDSNGNFIGNACSITADVFAGDPANNPGYFMAATINIQTNTSPYSGTPFEDTPFEDLLDPESFELIDENALDDFYSDDFLNGDYEGLDIQSVTGGGTITPEDLSDDKVNVLVLEGDLNLTGTMPGKKIVIINRNDSSISFAKETGQNKGKPEGWIIAPNSTITTQQGSPKIPMSVISEECESGSQNTCTHESGGSAFQGYELSGFGSTSTGSEDSNSTGNVQVDTSEDMQMDFDY
ncbi:hypothetical protein [Marinospirillum perlucidum]|uniref:hypothetical protein n=1 Tax=Marinospirillum perlucidum TaxID=1982602 RepID=UPI00138FA6D9|nr:hypothetical protein [Marinospirillum perlucidum]